MGLMLGCMSGIRVVVVFLAAPELEIVRVGLGGVLVGWGGVLVGLGGGMLIYKLCPLLYPEADTVFHTHEVVYY